MKTERWVVLVVLVLIVLAVAVAVAFEQTPSKPEVPAATGGVAGEHCGGFIRGAPGCAAGYHCVLTPVRPDTGGTCVADEPSATSTTH